MSGIDWRRRTGGHDEGVESFETRGNRVVVSLSWKDRSDERHVWTHGLELKDGRIVAMQDYANPSRAALATRVRTLLGKVQLRRAPRI